MCTHEPSSPIEFQHIQSAINALMLISQCKLTFSWYIFWVTEKSVYKIYMYTVYNNNTLYIQSWWLIYKKAHLLKIKNLRKEHYSFSSLTSSSLHCNCSQQSKPKATRNKLCKIQKEGTASKKLIKLAKALNKKKEAQE